MILNVFAPSAPRLLKPGMGATMTAICFEELDALTASIDATVRRMRAIVHDGSHAWRCIRVARHLHRANRYLTKLHLAAQQPSQWSDLPAERVNEVSTVAVRLAESVRVVEGVLEEIEPRAQHLASFDRLVFKGLTTFHQQLEDFAETLALSVSDEFRKHIKAVAAEVHVVPNADDRRDWRTQLADL